MNQQAQGLAYGFVGVFCFSLTLPATKFAIADLDPLVVVWGRALVAAVLAAVVLGFNRQAVPAARHWPSIAVVALGVVIGFPLFSTWAMQRVGASHGGILLGLIPLSTAVFAFLVGSEKPSRSFWLLASSGTIIVVGYALLQAEGHLQVYDLLLLAAVISAGLGYAVGAQLARHLGAWQVICWALLLAAPLALPAVAWAVYQHGFDPQLKSAAGFAYLSCVSMFLGFLAWYKGLALGGTAKVGLVQLLQPFMTLIAAVILLGEALTLADLVVALLVVAVVFAAQKTRSRGASAVNDGPVSATASGANQGG